MFHYLVAHIGILLLSLSFALATGEIPSLYSRPGLPPSPSMVNTIHELLTHKDLNPDIWPAIQVRKVKEAGLVMGPRHTIYEVELPVWNQFTTQFETFTFKLFAPENKEKRDTRLVVICPTIEGETILERSLARQAVSAGQTAVIAPVFAFDYIPGPKGFVHIKEKTIFGVNAIQTFFDLVEYAYKNNHHKFPESFEPLKQIFPADFIQIGISNGTVATQMASRDRRVSDQILIIPIGNVPGVFATTTNEKISKFREAYMRDQGLKTRKEFFEIARRDMRVDPLDITGDTKHVKTLAFTQSNDATVQSVFQKELSDRIRSSKLMAQLIEFRGDVNVIEAVHYHGKDPEREMLYSWLKSNLENDSDFFHNLDKAINSENHFHEVGWGHVKKILSIVFLFNEEIRRVLRSPTKNPHDMYKYSAIKEYRERPLIQTQSTCAARLK